MSLARPEARKVRFPGAAPAGALSVAYLSLIVLIPLAAVTASGLEDGVGGFWDAVTKPQALSALELTLLVSLAVAAINAVAGTLIAWVLVRDNFRGKGFVNALIDLPFALPTIVAGLTLLVLYGRGSPVGINVAFTQIGVALALLFVTLPFVVRADQRPGAEDLRRTGLPAGAQVPWTTPRVPWTTPRGFPRPSSCLRSTSSAGWDKVVDRFFDEERGVVTKINEKAGQATE